ncbi:hypothetical protein SAMN05660464_0907 [Geodermatophilus dictyosporus]|uniref:Uncharacterized protein n=1 Tax=Geodermatophilus dictyosporus TaxID=1523247 RepID=A0A1I5JNP2_9ACTN|nr:hypothetical protein [Geodermatophilus dictyosporus]SFO74422.1 hypothetical protein SAMN05660464_0907 [Geodermatophilus dictyosporus]
MLGVEVWGDGDAARRYLDESPLDSAAAGLEAPTVIVLVYPDVHRSVLPIVVGTMDEDTSTPGSLTGTATGQQAAATSRQRHGSPGAAVTRSGALS